MRINHKDIVYSSRSDKFAVIPIGDIHIGHIGCDKKRLKELISWIKDKENCYWIGMGDYAECINYIDPRFDPQSVEPQYLQSLSNCVPMQIRDIINLFMPIRGKCLGLHRGNHEETIRLKFQYDVMYELWKAFDVPLLDDTAHTRLCFKRRNTNDSWVVDVFSQHGRAGGRKGGNKINWLEDFIGYIDADVYLMAHAHIKESEVKTQLYVNKENVLCQRKKVLGVTGSFLRGYNDGCSSYVEKWMLPPTDLGVIKLTIIPDKRDIHVSL